MAKLTRNGTFRSGTAGKQFGEGSVIMFSGCRDDQTSADAQGASARGAGGACTMALKKALRESDDQSYARILVRMNEILKEGRYDQRPRLSSNQDFKLEEYKFNIPAKSESPYRALMVGINYIGTEAELAGCHNDVKDMKQYFNSKGYDHDECFRVLLDDGKHNKPTRDNILNGMKWLVEGAKPGTTLFFHYSGHGGSIPDDDGDEKDGHDECLFPVDYKQAGFIRDDDVSAILCKQIPKGVNLVAVCDCCHSGTIMDLPFTFMPEGEKGQKGHKAVHYEGKDIDGGDGVGGLGLSTPVLVAIVAVAVPIVIFAFSKLLNHG